MQDRRPVIDDGGGGPVAGEGEWEVQVDRRIY